MWVIYISVNVNGLMWILHEAAENYNTKHLTLVFVEMFVRGKSASRPKPFGLMNRILNLLFFNPSYFEAGGAYFVWGPFMKNNNSLIKNMYCFRNKS